MEPPLPGHFFPGRAGSIAWYLTLASPRPCLPSGSPPGAPSLQATLQVGIVLQFQLQATLVHWQGLEMELLSLKADQSG